MRRRDALRSLGVLGASLFGTGCLGSPGRTTDGETSGAATDPGTTTEPAPATVEPTPTTSRTSCSPVETNFEVPELSKPDPLTDQAANNSAWDVESAYWRAIEFSPRSLAPEDVDSFTAYRGMHDSVSDLDDEFLVTLTVRLAYGYDGAEEGEQQAQYDRPVDVAVYSVTTRRIVRTEGVGGLTGTLVCW